MADDAPRMPIPDAARELGMDVKRLRGLVYLGTLDNHWNFNKPIGSLVTDEIYVHEVEKMKGKKA